MVRTAASPWLRSLLRAGKQQRALARAVTVLVAGPTPPRARPKPKPKPAHAPLSVPAVPAASGKWLASHLSSRAEHGAMRRMSYWLYLPDHPPAPDALPLIVMLHGCGQSATQFAQGTRMNQWAQQRGYAVLYPQQSRSAHPQRCWKWYDRATQEGGGDAGLIVAIVRQVLAGYPVDPARVYIAGISAGAGMAHIVALNYPAVFAAVGLHSAPLFGAGHSTLGALGVMKHGASHRVESAIAEVLQRQPAFTTMPTMLIQGEADDVVHPINQIQLLRQAQLVNRLAPGLQPAGRRAATGASNPYTVHDARRGRSTLLRVARIGQLKHAWSGGDERLAYNCGAGPDASSMLLDFFGQHRRGA